MERPRVQRLDDVVVDQIAAGEVVERPASVVKELVENALDAGSTRILVELRDGGTALVRVVDDGCGMSRGDASLAIERHATSKIRAAEDLVGVSTLGFRGEALPSIASVSRFELITRPADEDVGTRVAIEGGRCVAVEDAGCAAGTEIRVRDLFFNIPARRKFLRTPQTEGQHAVEAIVRLALGRPDVAFTVRSDGRDVVNTRPCPDLATRAREVLGALARPLVPVNFARRGITVGGLASPQGVHQADSQVSYLYVNGRFVRDPVLRRAVARAYEDLVPRGRHPVVVLSMHVAPEDVDVNVHPAKTEVRFRDPRGLVDAVAEGLRAAVAPLPAPERVTPVAPALPLPGLFTPVAPPAPVVAAPPARVVAHPDDDPRLWTAPSAIETVGETPRFEFVYDVHTAPASAAPAEIVSDVHEVPVAAPPVEEAGEPWWLAGLAGPGPSASASASATLVHRLGPWALVARGDTLYLADLAALADRVARARFDAAVARGEVERRLFTPRVVAVGRAAAKLLERQDDLLALGLGIEGFGGGEIAVTAVPVGVPEPKAAELARRVAAAPEAAPTIVHGMLVDEILEETPALAALLPSDLREIDAAALRRLWGSL